MNCAYFYPVHTKLLSDKNILSGAKCIFIRHGKLWQSVFRTFRYKPNIIYVEDGAPVPIFRTKSAFFTFFCRGAQCAPVFIYTTLSDNNCCVGVTVAYFAVSQQIHFAALSIFVARAVFLDTIE